MKNTSEDLFVLIRSLNKAEKGYFKKQAGFHQRGEGNNYLKLFEVIEKQEVYNEKAILKKFASEKFIRQFPVAKNYLYQMVLRSLEQFHSDTDSELFSMYRQAALLFNRGLYDQSAKLASKAKERALKGEKFQLVLLLLRLEWSLCFKLKGSDVEVENERLGKETDEAISALKNTMDFQYQYVKVFSKSQKMGISRTSEQGALLDELMEIPLMNEAKGPRTLIAKSNFYKTMATYGFSKGSRKTVYEYTKKLAALVEDHRELFEPTFSFFLGMYGNLANACIGLGKTQEVKVLLRKIHALQPNNRLEETQQFEQCYQIELEGLVRAALFSEGVEAVQRFEKEYAERGLVNPSLKVLLPATAAYIEFVAGNYSRALKWINTILNEPDTELRNDIGSFVRIFDLVIHYEMGHSDLLEYKIRSAYRYLLKRKTLFAFEEVLMRNMKKLIGIHAGKELVQFFVELKKELEESSEEKEQRFMPEYDLRHWLESKISGRSFADVLAEKVKTKD